MHPAFRIFACVLAVAGAGCSKSQEPAGAATGADESLSVLGKVTSGAGEAKFYVALGADTAVSAPSAT